MNLQEGDKVRLKHPVWDEDTDQAYPPGYIGKAGDILTIKRINPEGWTFPLTVAHENTEGGFCVHYDEIEV